MSEATQSASARPLIITIICLLMAFGSLVALPLVFTQAARAVGPWYPPVVALSSIIGLISLVGFWQMRRWAVYLYTGVFIVTQAVSMSMGKANLIGIIIPIIVIVSGFVFLKRMR